MNYIKVLLIMSFTYEILKNNLNNFMSKWQLLKFYPIDKKYISIFLCTEPKDKEMQNTIIQ